MQALDLKAQKDNPRNQIASHLSNTHYEVIAKIVYMMGKKKKPFSDLPAQIELQRSINPGLIPDDAAHTARDTARALMLLFGQCLWEQLLGYVPST
jgi:hypothetical protein